MLHTKCKAKSRSLQALQHSRCALMHNLVQLQSSEQHLQHMQSSRKNRSISSYEWDVLQSSEKLRHHEESVVAAACVAADCRQAQYHVTAFFEWLATLHDGQQRATNAAHQVSQQLQCGLPCLNSISSWTRHCKECVQGPHAQSALSTIFPSSSVLL